MTPGGTFMPLVARVYPRCPRCRKRLSEVPVETIGATKATALWCPQCRRLFKNKDKP